MVMDSLSFYLRSLFFLHFLRTILLVITVLAGSFFQHFVYNIPVLLAYNASVEKSTDNLVGLPIIGEGPCLAAFKILSAFENLIVSQCELLWVYPSSNLLSLKLDVYFLSQIKFLVIGHLVI